VGSAWSGVPAGCHPTDGCLRRAPTPHGAAMSRLPLPDASLCLCNRRSGQNSDLFVLPFFENGEFLFPPPNVFFFFFFSRELKISPSALRGSGAAHKPAQRLCKYGCERRAAGGCYLQGRGTWGPNTSTANPSSPPMQGRLWPGRLLAARSYLMSGKCCSWEIGGCCRRGPAGSVRSCGHVQVLCVALPSGRLPARLRVTTLLCRLGMAELWLG